jgi:hypothetical protein
LFLVLAQQQEEEEEESFLQFVVDWNWLESDAGRRRTRCFLFFGGNATVDVMRVERSSSGTSLSCRRQERVLCMEVTVGESDEGGNEEVAAGEAPASAVAAAPEVGGECHGVASAGTTKSSKMSRKEDEGLYTLTRQNNSPVLEHNFCPYAKSLNRAVSEARVMSMQQLGLLACKQKDCTRDDDAFAAAFEALAAGSAAEP